MQTTLLYVRSPRQPHADGIREASLLDLSRIPYDECEDIYRALARLCRPDGAKIETVVVGIDGLLSDELAFFTLARVSRPDVRIYVHARHDARHLIALAIERGAAGALTEEILFGLRRSDQATDAPLPDDEPEDNSDTKDQKPAFVDVNEDPDRQEGVFADHEARDLAGEPCHEDQDPPDVENQEFSAPARVPWASRQDAPRRIRPAEAKWTDGADDEPDDAPEANASAPGPLSEPLLTQEELRALISDEPDSAPPTNYERPSDSEASS